MARPPQGANSKAQGVSRISPGGLGAEFAQPRRGERNDEPHSRQPTHCRRTADCRLPTADLIQWLRR